MSLFKRNPNEVNYVHGKKHFTDVIKNTGDGNLLIWLNGEEDFNTNSTLIVADSKKFLTKLVGNNVQFMMQDELKNYFRGEFSHIIGQSIRKYFNTSEEEIIIKCQNYDEIKNGINEPIANALMEYGIELVSLNIADIGVPEDDPYIQIYMGTRTQSAADQVKRIKDAKAAKEEQEILGINWSEQKSAEILKDLANNDGSIGVIAGTGSGEGIMSQLAQNIANHNVNANEEVNCPKCGTKNRKNAKFCTECGAKIGNICKNCGNELEDNEKFCNQCGTKRE